MQKKRVPNATNENEQRDDRSRFLKQQKLRNFAVHFFYFCSIAKLASKPNRMMSIQAFCQGLSLFWYPLDDMVMSMNSIKLHLFFCKFGAVRPSLSKKTRIVSAIIHHRSFNQNLSSELTHNIISFLFAVLIPP